MSLTASARKGTAAVAALAALALGGSAIAGAASTTSSSSDTPAATDTSGSRAHNETEQDIPVASSRSQFRSPYRLRIVLGGSRRDRPRLSDHPVVAVDLPANHA